MRLRTSILAAALVAMTAVLVYPQQANYTVDSDTYIAVASSAFPARVDFTALSSAAHVIGQDEINTYWFVKPDAAHAVVQLANGDSSVFLELSGIKQAYVFPTDASEAIGAATDLRVTVVGKDGKPHQLSTAPSARLTVHVVQRDALHLKLTFDGSMLGPSSSTPVPVKGAIALSKKSAELEHLPDAYPGCDNTIFDRMSPSFDLGQWRSSTACELSLRRKLMTAVDALLQPAYRYMQSQTWTCDPIKDMLSDRVRRGREHDPFRLANFQGAAMRGSCSPSAAAVTRAVPLDRITELATKLASLPPDPPPADRARVEKERQQIQDELTNIGKGVNEKQALAFEVTVNAPSSPDRPIEMSNGTIDKVSANEYVVANTGSAASGFSEVGGTYVLLGAWESPQRAGNRITMRPALPAAAKPLSVQAVMIRIGTGPDIAKQMLEHMDVRGFTALLPIAP
jgi:hypothetical protein